MSAYVQLFPDRDRHDRSYGRARVTITDDALDGETPDVFADLRTSGAGPCLGCGEVGIFRDRIERRLIGSPTAQVMTTVRGASP